MSKCLQCNKTMRGRTDKKFCDESCKNEYHNAQKLNDHAEIKKIDLALKKNRKILKMILADKKEEIVSKEDLLKKGFDFDFHSHHTISKVQNHEYIFCYNYGYRLFEGNKYKVVKSFK